MPVRLGETMSPSIHQAVDILFGQNISVLKIQGPGFQLEVEFTAYVLNSLLLHITDLNQLLDQPLLPREFTD